ncbi:hypothetical protein DRZ78_01655 [Candidatus Aerophobetes bacterium]|uniref:DUF91 domain-containing protein n=1 Tax=Aerophobetes bacterium TaxID=2030807 RepID=A0A662D4N8_UNCAE|nr:MAG: hypothetical protein DRZ78_01655 [Candidatus Aerophobetes bacterium]
MEARHTQLLPEERKLWDAFLRLYGREWDRYEYRVLVGPARPVLPGTAPEFRRMVEEVSRKRIDVIGWKGSEPTIFEVKPFAGSTALGQLLAYRSLWAQDHHWEGKIGLAVVTNDVHPADREVFERFGVRIFLVPL